MKAFLFGTVAAVALALGFAPQQASASWAYRTSYRWDPVCCRYVAYQERYWVPDRCDSGYQDPYYGESSYRGWHRHHHHHDRPYFPLPYPYGR